MEELSTPPELGGKNSTGGKFGERELKLSYWLLTHQILFKKILTGVIIGVAVIFWLYALIGFIDWAFITGPKERANIKTTLEVRTAREALEKIKAQDIVFTEAQVFAGGIGQYDMWTKAQNSNEKWRAEFEYRFVGEGYEGKWKQGFILPNEEKYIADLGVELVARPRNIRFETQNFNYHRIDPHKIPNYEVWRDARLNILTSEKVFNPRVISGNKNIAQLSFKAENDSAYSYWSVGFYALLYRGTQLVAINYLNAEDFASGEERELQMQFYEGLPTISKTEIIPEVDIFDEGNYKR